MKSIIDSFWALRDDVQHFRYSLVISVLLILIIISILLVIGNIFYSIENRLVGSNNYLGVIIMVLLVEIIFSNLIFLTLGSWFFRIVNSSYYIIY